jgi:calcium-dependent protein kinase
VQQDTHIGALVNCSACFLLLHCSYDIGKPLGRGRFGTTRLVINKVTGEQLACKSIAKHKLLKEHELLQEIQIMQHLAGHPNVVQLRSVHEDQHSVHLVMDLCQGGELTDCILQRKQFTESDAAAIMRTVVEVSWSDEMPCIGRKKR